jgi:hypothetical protein
MGRQWGNTDDAANSVLWATTAVNLPPNTVNQALLFGNTTQGAWNNNGVAMKEAVGQFGLDSTEIGVQGNSSIVTYVVTAAGTGYAANPVVTVANSTGGANVTAATATATSGKISAVTANLVIAGYTTAPTVSIAAPASINITANSVGFSNTSDVLFVTTASSRFAVNDRVYYAVPASNTAIAPLTANSYYFVSFVNATALALSTVVGGANVNITDARVTAVGEVHTIQGDTATAVPVLSGVPSGAAHTGWVLRTVGQGGRAGRVQYETLVAMNSGQFAATDAEDVVLKDS